MPRVTVKLQEDSRGGSFWATFPLWVVDHLNAEKGTVLKPSIWRKGNVVKLDEDAVIFEVIQDEP